METNHQLLKMYKNLIQTTQIQECYQYIMKLIHDIYTILKNDLNTFQFSNKVIENNMNFSYFQLTNPQLKKQGLKIQIIFIHQSCQFEVWLSGYNRHIQQQYYQKLNSKCPFQLCENPQKNDYIVKIPIIKNITIDDTQDVINEIKLHIEKISQFFINEKGAVTK